MQITDRRIVCQTDIPAPVGEVWRAWTTESGLVSFFAPKVNIRPEPDGLFEILFDPDAAEGSRGAEGMRILAIQPEELLSFTWNAPPHLPEARKQRTHVEVRLEPVGKEITRVWIIHGGWASGGEWDAAYQYFERAWKRTVLPRLKYRFTNGPVDWFNLPKL